MTNASQSKQPASLNFDTGLCECLSAPDSRFYRGSKYKWVDVGDADGGHAHKYRVYHSETGFISIPAREFVTHFKNVPG